MEKETEKKRTRGGQKGNQNARVSTKPQKRVSFPMDADMNEEWRRRQKEEGFPTLKSWIISKANS